MGVLCVAWCADPPGRRAGIWKVIAALTLVAVVVFLLVRSQEPARLDEAPPGEPDSSLRIAPDAAEPGLDKLPERREVGKRSAGFSRLTVRVVELGSLNPVAGFRIEAQLVTPPGVDVAPGAESLAVGGVPLTDEVGEATFEVPALRKLKLGARAGGDWSLFSAATLTSPPPGEESVVILRVSYGGDARLFGRVVAGKDGSAIAGARIYADTSPWNRTTEPAAVTDSLGQFFLPRKHYENQALTFTAAGFGPAMAKINRQHTTPSRAFEIGLEVEAVLSGRVHDSNRGLRAVRVSLETESYELGVPAEGECRWISSVGPDGTFRLAGLPPHVFFRAAIYWKAEPVWHAPAELVLGAGEHRVVEWWLDGGATLLGTAIDTSDGQPARALDLWLLPCSEVRGNRFAGRERDPRRATTDADGAFVFSGLIPGEWAVGPAPAKRRFGLLPDTGAVVPTITRVTIADPSSATEVVLRVEQGEYIEGLVLDPDGQPAAEVVVSAAGLDGGGWVDSESIATGAFRVGPLVPGVYTLRAGEYFSRQAPSDPIDVRSGATGVVLKLKPGGVISGQVVDALTGSGLQSKIGLGQIEFGSTTWTLTEADGSFKFNGKEVGQYQLIASTEDGRIGMLQTAVSTIGASVEGLKVGVSPGGAVRVRYRGPWATASFMAFSGGVNLYRGTLRNSETKTFTAPAGMLTLELLRFDREAGIYPPPRQTEQSKEIMVRQGQTTSVEFEVDD